MKPLTKPKKLNTGDTVATISLSWGGAGDSEKLWRYNQGKERLEKVFGLRVIEMPHTLSGTEYVYNHPEKRAEDLLAAFADPQIKGIFSCIGGEETIRLLPYIDFDVIRANSKIFVGYSDTTVNHFMCLKAGLSSFYGGAVLVDFAENIAMSNYTVEHIKRTLFSAEPLGEILPSETWTSQYLPWKIENKDIARSFTKNRN
jgi:muramoyltetrapeptide carboxypeptidase LdcA involved in peptidoglycan recycling